MVQLGHNIFAKQRNVVPRPWFAHGMPLMPDARTPAQSMCEGWKRAWGMNWNKISGSFDRHWNIGEVHGCSLRCWLCHTVLAKRNKEANMTIDMCRHQLVANLNCKKKFCWMHGTLQHKKKNTKTIPLTVAIISSVLCRVSIIVMHFCG